MIPELRDLYQEVILDHYKKPRNARRIEGASHTAEGNNPLCGDRITVYVRMEGDRIADLAFQGTGCAISQASASLMTLALKGKTKDDAEGLAESFRKLVMQGPEAAGPADFGSLAAFGGLSEFPIRVKCATLAWHTLRSALDLKEGHVTTE